MLFHFLTIRIGCGLLICHRMVLRSRWKACKSSKISGGSVQKIREWATSYSRPY
jgi:hypothetical protein